MRTIFFLLMFILFSSSQSFADIYGLASAMTHGSFSKNIHNAIKAGDYDRVLAILKKNSTMVLATDDGLYPIHVAAFYGRANIVKLLAKYAHVDKENTYYNYSGNPTFRDKNGVRYPIYMGYTPLMLATYKEYPLTTKALIDEGANIYAYSKDTETPFAYALGTGNAKILQIYIDKGADLRRIYDDGETYLEYALRRGYVDGVKHFIKNGFDINGKNELGQTYLMQIAQKKEADKMIENLLALGVDVNAKDKNGMQAIHYMAKNPKISEYDFIQTMVKLGADIHSEGPNGWQAIHYACRYARPTMTKSFVDAGADITAKTKDHTLFLNQAKSVMDLAKKNDYRDGKERHYLIKYLNEIGAK